MVSRYHEVLVSWWQKKNHRTLLWYTLSSVLAIEKMAAPEERHKAE